METVKEAPGWGGYIVTAVAPNPSAAIAAATLPAPRPLTAPPVPPHVGPRDVLDGLVDSIAAVRGAVLATVDGFPVATSSAMSPEPSHAAMLAAAIGLARQLVGMGDGTALRQLVVDHDGGLLIVWPIGTQRVLAVVAGAAVDQRVLRSFVHANARLLAGRSSVVER